MQFNLCENTGFFLRVALIGPAGSGKTYTALQLATELGYDKIGIIDTENRSARRYARAFGQRFQSLELQHFSPRDYIEAIRAAEQSGIEVLVIDSLSHAWAGKGGVLEMVDQSARRQARGGSPSSFSGWREVTPEHNRLVEALVQARLHLIVTMRTKTEYVIDKDEKGRAVPRKVGLQPVQRDGLEYEFDIVGDLSPEHDLIISKSRCPQLADTVMQKPGPELSKTLRAWVDGAAAAEAAEGDAQADADDDGDSDEGEETAEAAEAKEAQAQPGEQPSLPLVRPALRPLGPRPRGEARAANVADELGAITPWLRRIQEAEERGSEEQLDQVRGEMNEALRKRTRAQGEALRRAIESAKAAIRARDEKAAAAQPGEQAAAR